MSIHMTINEASALTGLSIYTLREAASNGTLKAWRPTPRGTRVTLAALAEANMLPPEVRAMLPDDLTKVDARDILNRLVPAVTSAG